MNKRKLKKACHKMANDRKVTNKELSMITRKWNSELKKLRTGIFRQHATNRLLSEYLREKLN